MSSDSMTSCEFRCTTGVEAFFFAGSAANAELISRRIQNPGIRSLVQFSVSVASFMMVRPVVNYFLTENICPRICKEDKKVSEVAQKKINEVK